ncbi:MAG: ATP-binding protein, partial [Thaumarchaeota archaeon]|nr:ATP-binding protein [Nitrososphaerota archaeon]
MSELFEEFLRTYEDKGEEHKYRNRMAQLAATGGKSIVVDYEDIIQFNTDLGQNLLSQPDESLKEFRTAAFEVLSTENPSYASQIRTSLNVRIRGITDKIPLRKVDTSHLDKMIAASGMVVRSSELRPLLTDAAFICPNGHLTMIKQEGVAIKRPLKCDGCEETRNLELDEKKSSFIDSQLLRVQELPEELPPGQLPRFFDVDVVGDIVNTARPGDRLVLTGIVRAEQDITPGQARTRVFRSKIESNLIEVAGKDPGQIQITKEDEFLIRSVASNPDAYQRLIKSIAPAILGHDAVKEAILLLLVGGPQTILPDGTKLRGDINVFVVGDPGVAKSEMLKFAAQVAPRGMFASGKGSTAAGLSAAVIREKNTFMLEAGVVVLADQGIACIDEFDKMKEDDRSALHEQMEQQTVTIAKGGIFATLNARTSILAAANPIFGKYDPYKNLTDNITLPIPLLSVGPEEQILIRRGDKVESTKIGRFVDSFYSPGQQGYPINTEESGIQVSSMDGDFKIAWKPLKYVFRHIAESETYRIQFKGRDLVLSGGHCVYIFEKGRLALKPTNQLRVGDYIVIAKRLPPKGEFKREYNVLEYLSCDELLLHQVPNKALRGMIGIADHHRRRNMLSASRYREVGDKALRRTTVSKKGSGFYVPTFVPLDARLMRLLGYFVAEGSLVFMPKEGVYAVDFSLHRTKDRRIVSDIISISRKLFRVEPTTRADGNGVKVDIRSRVVAEFLSNCFGLVSGATTKKIPDVVFAAPPELKWQFLDAYYAGDAGVTASVELSSQLLQVFAQLGHISSLFRTPGGEKIIAGHKAKGSGSYFVPTPRVGPTSNDGQCYPPLSEVIPLLKPLLGELSPRNGVRKALTPLYWEQLRDAIWVRNKREKLEEVRKGPMTAASLAKKFGIKGGGGCQGFVKKMSDEGILQRERIVGQAGRHYMYSLTKQGEMLLETVEYLDKVVAGDIAFVKVDEIRRLENAELPRYVYDLSVPGSENFIADTAICHNTRFDLIFVIKDTPTPAQDERLATHILDVHRRGTFAEPPPVQFDLMKKYITYAKKISPKLTTEAENRLKEFYLQLRRSVAEGQIGATPRTLESLIRLSSARARLMLREQVLEEDALAAIALMNRMVEDVLTDTETKTKADFGILLGQPAGERGKLSTSMEIFRTLEGSEKKPVELKLFRDELVKTGRFKTDDEVDKMIQKLIKEGIIWEN